MKGIVSWLILVVVPGWLQGQAVIKTIDLDDEIIMATVDRPGDFYLITRDGRIQKFDKDGSLVAVREGDSAPTVFEPRDGARLFAYYRDAQRCDYFNPSLEVVASHPVDPAFAITPWLVCTSGDHNLWLLDRADNGLRKLNATHTEVEVDVVIDSALIGDASRITMLRDYQGFVFALDPGKGIFVFNRFGKYLRTIGAPGIQNFNFLGQDLYYLQDGRIRMFDLFTAEGRELPSTPIDGIDVILTDKRMLIVHRESVEIRPFSPH